MSFSERAKSSYVPDVTCFLNYHLKQRIGIDFVNRQLAPSVVCVLCYADLLGYVLALRRLGVDKYVHLIICPYQSHRTEMGGKQCEFKDNWRQPLYRHLLVTSKLYHCPPLHSWRHTHIGHIWGQLVDTDISWREHNSSAQQGIENIKVDISNSVSNQFAFLLHLWAKFRIFPSWCNTRIVDRLCDLAMFF